MCASPLYQPVNYVPRPRLPCRIDALIGWRLSPIGVVFHLHEDRACLFGTVRHGTADLSRVGCIVHRLWTDIPDHFDHARLDAFVVMPNHVHGLIGLVPDTNSNANATMSAISPKPGSVSTIIRSYKSAVTRWVRRNDCSSLAWQPRFYDHIVRNRRSFRRIRRLHR